MSGRKKPPGKGGSGGGGYCNPPFRERFGQKTRTGRVNTSGRPKKKKAPPTLDDELNKKVPIRQGGRRKTSTVREAVHKRLVQRALEGDFRAIKLVMEYDARLKEEDGETNPFDIDPTLMAGMLKQYEEEVEARARRGRRRKRDEADKDE